VREEEPEPEVQKKHPRSPVVGGGAKTQNETRFFPPALLLLVPAWLCKAKNEPRKELESPSAMRILKKKSE